jgi:predicted dehydrogenase
MKAGINVLIEKPMAMTTRDAQTIVENQETANVKAGVIHNWLFDGPVLAARSMVEKGELGEIQSADVEALNTKDDSMAANEHHWSHQLPGGRFSEMLAHPIYLLREFLRGEVKCVNIEVSKIGNYPWMKSDELCATFRVGNKLGRAYASFNSPREAIYISLNGTSGILKLDVINSTLNVLPARKTSRTSRGYDSLRQASQLVKCTAINAGKVAAKNWYSGHDMCIKQYAQSLTDNTPLPVSVKDGYHVVKTLEEMCNQIKIAENARE